MGNISLAEDDLKSEAGVSEYLKEAENFSISSDTVAKGLVLSEGEYVKISIKDQGVGIPAEHLSLIDAPVNVMILLPFMMKN